MAKNNIKIIVLMSTYNGAKYLEEQVDSIFDQNNVDVHLIIRDDGSTDETVNLINRLRERYGSKITTYFGDNVGYRHSFLYLLSVAPDAEYYAFSDQDDVWKPNKLCVAINKLNSINDPIRLYASELTITDDKLNNINVKRKSYKINGIESYFTRARLAGCTYVFSQELKKLAVCLYHKNKLGKVFDHDFLVGSCAFACGTVFIDKKSYIFHRRLNSSVTSGGNGLVKRFKAEYRNVFLNKNFHKNMAMILLDNCYDIMKPNAKRFLKIVSKYDINLKNYINLLFYKGRTSGIFICDVEQFFKISILNY